MKILSVDYPLIISFTRSFKINWNFNNILSDYCNKILNFRKVNYDLIMGQYALSISGSQTWAILVWIFIFAGPET